MFLIKKNMYSKTMMAVIKKDIITSSCKLQISGQKSEEEAAVHAMRRVFKRKKQPRAQG